MSDTIFYSWQSDLPNSTNRGFIGDALEKAVRTLRQDETLQVEPVIDRDTAGVPGSPDIAATIFEKIARAQVFVCDVSLINQGSPKPTPNPNVLIEFGYALSVLGAQRIIIVVNQAFGKVEDLPFDLRIKRAVTYRMPKEQSDRASGRNELSRQFADALRAIFNAIQAERSRAVPVVISPLESALRAVEDRGVDQVPKIDAYMDWLVTQFESLNPNYSRSADTGAIFLEAIEQTKPLLIEFARLTNAIASIESRDAALALYRKFEVVFTRYDYIEGDGHAGWRLNNGYIFSYDFYHFVGHEFFVTFFSCLIRQQCWTLIADLLEEEFYIHNGINEPGRIESYAYSNGWVGLLAHQPELLGHRYTNPRGELLKRRHSEGELATVVPFQQFMDADLFFFLRSGEPDSPREWTSWTTLYLTNAPRYLVQAERRNYATQLLRPFDVPDLESLRDRLEQRKGQHSKQSGVSFRNNPLPNIETNRIGSR